MMVIDLNGALNQFQERGRRPLLSFEELSKIKKSAKERKKNAESYVVPADGREDEGRDQGNP
jgi:hypothetical protein